MTKHLFFLIITLLSAQFAFSQSNFQPGYIINLKGDTVKGSVNIGAAEINPKVIQFMEREGGIFTQYSVIDLKGFGVMNNHYVSAEVAIDTTSNQLEQLTYSAQFTTSQTNVFLLKVVDGVKSLYYLKDRKQKEFFFIKKDEAYQWLYYKRYLKADNGPASVFSNNRYRAQLTEYLGDCPSIAKKVGEAQYTWSGLSDVFAKYYECTGSTLKYQRAADKTKFYIGIIAGASLTKFKAKASGYSYLYDYDGKTSRNLTAGLSLEVVLSRSGKWSLYNELIYTKYRGESEVTEVQSADNINHYTTELALSHIKMNNLIRYTIPSNTVEYFINVGLSNGYAVQTVNKLTNEETFYTTKRTTESEAISSLTNYEMGYLAGVGGRLKKYSVQLRYEYGSNLANREVNFRTQKLFLIIGYNF